MDWEREDLENKSKEELIDIIMNLQEEIDCLYENECDGYKE